uniref:Uncharacterized protein n=1 Tax=Anguilla anguilla TaxID=7936 RepID=A0A0E9P7Z8_ANGAN
MSWDSIWRRFTDFQYLFHTPFIGTLFLFNFS